MFKILAAPLQYFASIMTTIWSTYKPHEKKSWRTDNISKYPVQHLLFHVRFERSGVREVSCLLSVVCQPARGGALHAHPYSYTARRPEEEDDQRPCSAETYGRRDVQADAAGEPRRGAAGGGLWRNRQIKTQIKLNDSHLTTSDTFGLTV